MPEPHLVSNTRAMLYGTASPGFEHELIVMLPYRRYRPGVFPHPCDRSPTNMNLGDVSRFGTELIAMRQTAQPELTEQERNEMLGELAEAWVALTAWSGQEQAS